jgi:hypothetical protein
MKTGKSKIGNLPAQIRDELNYRISDGEPGNELVECWAFTKTSPTPSQFCSEPNSKSSKSKSRASASNSSAKSASINQRLHPRQIRHPKPRRRQIRA